MKLLLVYQNKSTTFTSDNSNEAVILNLAKMKYNGALIDKVSNRNYVGRCENGQTFTGNLGYVKNQIDDLVKMQNRNSK